MDDRIVEMTRIKPNDDNMIKRAAERLVEGALVAFPTETVYGLGAHPDCLEAIRKIYDIKGRDFKKPLGMHISDHSVASTFAENTNSELFKKLTKAFWPGPLTIIMPKKREVSDAITAGLSTVGLRFPSHEVGINFIDKAGGAIPATSANLSGGFSATSAKDVCSDLDGEIDYLVEGDAGLLGIESTVISLVDGLKILRRGAIGASMINAALGYEAIAESGNRLDLEDERADAVRERVLLIRDVLVDGEKQSMPITHLKVDEKCMISGSDFLTRYGEDAPQLYGRSVQQEGGKIVFYSFGEAPFVLEEVSRNSDTVAIVFKERMYYNMIDILQNPDTKSRVRLIPETRFISNFYKYLRSVNSSSIRTIYIPYLEGSGVEASIMSLLSKY